MGHALFIGFFLVGAGVIALWFSFRFPTIEPATLGRITIHPGASLPLLALVPIGTGLVASIGDTVELRLVAIFAVVFPVLVFALLVVVWPIKIAQAAFGGRQPLPGCKGASAPGSDPLGFPSPSDNKRRSKT